MTLSSQWKRRHEDTLAQKQRWYCPACEARYKTSSGVLVELIRGGKAHYVQADFPPESIQEVKWSSVQRAHDDARTPAELLAAIPEAAPAEGVVLQKMRGLPGSWLYNDKVLAEIPRLNWARLLSEGAGVFSDRPVAASGASNATPPAAQ